MQALLTRRPKRATPAAQPLFQSLRLLATGGLLAGLSPVTPVIQQAEATPLICTTSLEAPILSPTDPTGPNAARPAPVEVSRCVPVENTMQMIERRAYTWSAPYAPGVSVLNQATDILGIAMGGPNGNRVMGLGFPDQTLIWDGTAIQNTTYSLLELQSNPMPLRTPDLVSVFNSSLASGGRLGQPPNPEEGGMPRYYVNPPLSSGN